MDEIEDEVNEILRNALAAYRSKEITREQYLEVTRIPLMDLCLERTE